MATIKSNSPHFAVRRPTAYSRKSIPSLQFPTHPSSQTHVSPERRQSVRLHCVPPFRIHLWRRSVCLAWFCKIAQEISDHPPPNWTTRDDLSSRTYCICSSSGMDCQIRDFAICLRRMTAAYCRISGFCDATIIWQMLGMASGCLKASRSSAVAWKSHPVR